MSRKHKKDAPRTRLRFSELLGDISIVKLAREIGVTYTQLYAYKKSGANPTLRMLEQIAEGLSKLRNEDVAVVDLIISPGRPQKTRKAPGSNDNPNQKPD